MRGLGGRAKLRGQRGEIRGVEYSHSTRVVVAGVGVMRGVYSTSRIDFGFSFKM